MRPDAIGAGDGECQPAEKLENCNVADGLGFHKEDTEAIELRARMVNLFSFQPQVFE